MGDWSTNAASMVADLERVAAELGEPPRVVRRIALPPDDAEKLRDAMRLERLEGVEVISNAMLDFSGERRAVIEYTDGTVEMHFRGKVIPLGKSLRPPTHMWWR